MHRIGPFLALASVACEPGGRARAPEPTVVTATSKGLMFRYLDGQGELRAAETLDDVPDHARAEVLVIDEGQSPEERGAGAWVHLADLRTPAADGRYPVRVVARTEFETLVRQARPAGPAVTMYSTSWCGVCARARRFMERQHIVFIEKDVEKDAGAAAELQRKVAAGGVSAGGVPVFEVGGVMLPGFDPDRLMSLLRRGVNGR